MKHRRVHTHTERHVVHAPNQLEHVASKGLVSLDNFLQFPRISLAAMASQKTWLPRDIHHRSNGVCSPLARTWKPQCWGKYCVSLATSITCWHHMAQGTHCKRSDPKHLPAPADLGQADETLMCGHASLWPWHPQGKWGNSSPKQSGTSCSTHDTGQTWRSGAASEETC